MKRHLHCAEQQEPPSNITKYIKYCACHAQKAPKHERNFLKTAETSLTARGATEATDQRHQILRLLQKLTLQNMKEIF